MRRFSVGNLLLAVYLAFGVFAASAAAGGTKPTSSAVHREAAVNPADLVGSEVCATCHGEIASKFASNAHSKLALQHGGKGVTCEGCHGPGREHVESGGDATKIFQFDKAAPQKVDEKCLSCHAGDHANFERSSHGAAGVSCTGCHSTHAAKSEEHMLKLAQPELCYGCHTETKAAFSQPSHHRVNEGLMTCSDCHNPHGTFLDKNLKSAADGNAICTKCHADAAGPFVYEHPPIKTEGCTSCHFAHGSPNPRLLTRSNVNSLCLQCHTASDKFTAPGTPSFHNMANQYQACTTCHVQIHGSNASFVFFK